MTKAKARKLLKALADDPNTGLSYQEQELIRAVGNERTGELLKQQNYEAVLAWQQESTNVEAEKRRALANEATAKKREQDQAAQEKEVTRREAVLAALYKAVIACEGCSPAPSVVVEAARVYLAYSAKGTCTPYGHAYETERTLR